MKKLLALLILLSCFCAWALDLNELRTNGVVGELPDGHVAAVAGSAAPDVTQFINDINAKRDAEYAKIAGDNKLAPADVGTMTHKKIVEKLQKGHFYQSGGKWTQK
ncbi:MAG: YdbL family protein [Pseudomonadota bacterium]